MTYMSIGIREETKHMLESIKRERGVKTYDELIRHMALKNKGSMLDHMFGMAPGVGNFKRDKDEFERF